MTDLRTAAQQALEALEGFAYHGKAAGWPDAVTTLRAALAEPVQEPVKLWPLASLTGYYDVGGKRVWLEKDDPFPELTPPQREPLAELERCKQVCAATAEGWRVERDALLEALQEALEVCIWPNAQISGVEEKARAAIKAVEGEKT